jgi:hypothetical protein
MARSMDHYGDLAVYFMASRFEHATAHQSQTDTAPEKFDPHHLTTVVADCCP